MKTDLTSAQIAQYQNEGWLIVEDFLPPGELAALSDAVETGVQAMGGTKVSGEHNEGIKDNPDTYYDKDFLQRVNNRRVNDNTNTVSKQLNTGQSLIMQRTGDSLRNGDGTHLYSWMPLFCT